MQTFLENMKGSVISADLQHRRSQNCAPLSKNFISDHQKLKCLKLPKRSVVITTLAIVNSQENQMAADITILKPTAWIKTATKSPGLEDTQKDAGLDKLADSRANAPINIPLNISMRAKKSLKQNNKS